MDNWTILIVILILFGFVKILQTILLKYLIFCNWCELCCNNWNKLTNKIRLIITNSLWGIFIILMLLPFQDGSLSSTEDANIDWMMQIYQGSTPLKETPPFVLFDIDEYTYRQWQEPLITPRDKLLQLVKLAVEKQAKVILIDIDLAYPIDRQNTVLHEADQALYEYIYNYEQHYCTNQLCPNIILARTFYTPLNIHNQLNNNSYYKQRHSFLDTAVNNSEHIHWASTLFELQHDYVLRRWRLWEITCNNQANFPNKLTIIPSIQLLTVALLNDPNNGNNKIENTLGKILPTDCTNNINQEISLGSQSSILELNDNLSLHLIPSHLNRRILYTIPWQLKDDKIYPILSDGNSLLNIMPVSKIIDGIKMNNAFPTKNMLNIPVLKDSIVVIGGSYENSHDLYETPLGKMPGTMILINAIHSLLQYGELRSPPSIWITIFKTIFLILLMTLVFSYFSNNPCYGMLVSTIITMLTIVFASFWVFKDGIWLNFVFPLLIVQINQTISSLKINPCAIFE